MRTAQSRFDLKLGKAIARPAPQHRAYHPQQHDRADRRNSRHDIRRYHVDDRTKFFDAFRRGFFLGLLADERRCSFILFFAAHRALHHVDADRHLHEKRLELARAVGLLKCLHHRIFHRALALGHRNLFGKLSRHAHRRCLWFSDMIKDHHRRSSAAENFVDPMFIVPIFRDLLIRAVEIDIEVDRRIAGVVVQKGQPFLALADAQQQLRVDEKTFWALIDIRGLGIEQRIGGGLDRSFWLGGRFVLGLQLARIFRRLLFVFARDRGALALGLTLLARIGHRHQSGQRQKDDPCPLHDSMELVVLSSFAGT